jgi:hypothetical protein
VCPDHGREWAFAGRDDEVRVDASTASAGIRDVVDPDRIVVVDAASVCVPERLVLVVVERRRRAAAAAGSEGEDSER